MSFHRGPGLTALSRHTTSSQAYSALSSQLTAQQLSDLRSQLEIFSSALRSFASTHKNEILKNPEFRGEFQRMCANIGVDPMGGAGPLKVSGSRGKIAGIWNDLLGLADFNYELGVQIVDVCISTRELNGGVIEMDELIARIRKLRTGDGRQQTNQAEDQGAAAISEEDVVRSIKTLAPLCSGYQVVALSTALNAPKIVRSLPGELSLDSTLLLSLLACSSCPRDSLGSDYACLTEEFVMLPRNAEEPVKPRWSRQRARAALDRMAQEEGTLWVDVHNGQAFYYSLASTAPARPSRAFRQRSDSTAVRHHLHLRLLSNPSRRKNGIQHNILSTASLSSRHVHARLQSSAVTPNAGAPIAILGGGISGLTTALHLSRHLPSHRKIILYEAQDRLGGWIESEAVKVKSDDSTEGTAILEGGPRSIRPKGLSGWTMIELISSLKLMDRLIIVPSTDPSARNRFISFRGRLNKLPSSPLSALWAFLTLPVLRSLLPSLLSALIREPFRRSQFQRPASESKDEVLRQKDREFMLDESVESFIRRRFGDAFGGKLMDNILSAVIHGIYACDARLLSVRSAFPFLWETEQKHGSLLRALVPPKWNRRFREPDPLQSSKADSESKNIDRIKGLIGPKYTQALEAASVYSLKNGIGEIVRAIHDELLRKSNVEIRLNERVCEIKRDDCGAFSIITASSAQPVSRIISSMSSAALATAMSGVTQSAAVGPLLKRNPSTSVGVVNFAIPNDVSRAVAPECAFLNNRSCHITGPGAFGFLIPRCESKSKANELPDSLGSMNEEGVLGVVFDSDAITGQDEVPRGVTKLTVMIGGPHFAAATGHEQALKPSEADISRRAVDALHRHLTIPEAVTTHERTMTRVRLQHNCIPTYLPGHFPRMWQLHRELLKLDHLTVTGASYTGVSINDIVKSSIQTAEYIVEKETRGQGGGVTGLENFDSDTRGPMAGTEASLPLDTVSSTVETSRSFVAIAKARVALFAFGRGLSAQQRERRTSALSMARRAFSTCPQRCDNPNASGRYGPLPTFLSSAPERPLRFIWLDLHDTLLGLPSSLGWTFAHWARTRHGLNVDHHKARDVLPQVLSEMQAQYPNFGKGFEQFPTAEDWRKELIHRVFLAAGPREHSKPGAKGLRKGEKAIEKAWHRIGRDASYEELYKVMRSSLTKRCSQMYRNNELYHVLDGSRELIKWINKLNHKRKETGEQTIGVGFADNSEPTIKQTCQALGLNANKFCLSYQVGAIKPDPAFFETAKSMAEVEFPEQILYVGDSLEEDAVPAANAGMRSIWLCKRKGVPKPVAPTQMQLRSRLGERGPEAWESYEKSRALRREMVRNVERAYLEELQQAKLLKHPVDFDIADGLGFVKERVRQIVEKESQGR